MPIWPCHITVQHPPDQLRKNGPLLPGGWLHPNLGGPLQIFDCGLLVDTGSPGTMIDEAVATELKLPVQGEGEVHGLHGYDIRRRYLGSLVLPVIDSSGEALHFVVPAACTGVPNLREAHERQGVSVVGILGRNFLQFCTLEVDGLAGRVVIRIDESVQRARN